MDYNALAQIIGQNPTPIVLTTAQRDALVSPRNGLIIYNSSTDQLNVRIAGAWETIGENDVTTHAALTTGIHGVGAGDVVGTGLTQTLTDKTLTDPTIQGTVGAGTGLTLPALTAGGVITLGANPDLAGFLATNTHELFRALMRETLGFNDASEWIQGSALSSGSGVVAVNTNTIFVVQTGATHASSYGRYVTMRALSGGGNSRLDWNRKLWVAFPIYWESGGNGANLTMRVVIGQNNTIADLAAHGLGMQTNGLNINLVTYGANGALATVSAATSLVTFARVWILIEHDPASADRLYINGVLKATQSTAGDIPSTEPAAPYYIVGSISRSGGVDVGNERFAIGRVALWQEF